MFQSPGRPSRSIRKLSIRKLKDIHTATHPAKMMRAQLPEQEPELDEEGLLSALAA